MGEGRWLNRDSSGERDPSGSCYRGVSKSVKESKRDMKWGLNHSLQVLKGFAWKGYRAQYPEEATTIPG